MKTITNSSAGLAIASLLLAACGSDSAAEGELTIAIYGEEFIEEGIPESAFVDGWAVNFDRFLITTGAVRAKSSSESEMQLLEYRVWDLAMPSSGEGHPMGSAVVAGGAYDEISYSVAASDSAAAGNATDADVARMRDGGFSILVEGVASKGQVQKTFSWGFTNTTRYSDCEGTAEVDGGSQQTEITIHADHLFYDMLVDVEPNVAFDLIASADVDQDDVITEAELRAVDLSSETRYQVGSLPVNDLWTFVDYQTSTVGHIDGEGHCNEFVRE